MRRSHACFAALCFAPLLAVADARFTWSGRLLDSSDQPVEGQVPMTFTFYSASQNGTDVWHETYQVNVRGGLYSVVLGDTTSGYAPIPDNLLTQTLWLQISVGGVKLLPRHQLAAEPNQCE